MLLREILKETQQEFYVYRAIGAHTPHVYYGYTTNSNVAKHFFSAGDDEIGRGSSQLIRANRGDHDSIKVEPIEIFDNQYEAWVSRNDYRASDGNSIVGPSHLPTNFMNQAAATMPEKVKQWKIDPGSIKTARDAFRAGKWAKETIHNLAPRYKKQQVVMDLDQLSPEQFAVKYNV